MSFTVWECVGDRVGYLQSLPSCGTGPRALARSTLLIQRVVAKMLKPDPTVVTMTLAVLGIFKTKVVI